MNCDNFVNLCQQTGRCNISQAEKVLNSEIREYGDLDDSFEMYVRMGEVAQAVSKSEVCNGSSDDFHNLAVTFARKEEMDWACDILDRGLEKFPRSTDLLADYLNYGVICGRFSQCEKYLDALERVPKSLWGWRAYSFSIDYLMALLDREESAGAEADLEKRARRIMAECADSSAYYEEYYLALSSIERKFGDQRSELRVLEEGMEKLKVAPKCSLRAADIYFKNGDIDLCQKTIKRCEVDALEPQIGVSLSYVALMHLLCILVNAMKREGRGASFEDVLEEGEISMMQDQYRIAKRLLPGESSMTKTLDAIVDIVEVKAGISLLD